MDQYPYWKKQLIDKPLYPDIEWSKPEQKSQAGRLGIIGGNKLGFSGVAESYTKAIKAGAGEVRVLLPDMLKKMIPSSMTDVVFGPTNPSGGLSRDALADMKVIGSWSTGILLIGDAGRNSETSILYEDFIREYKGPLTITRDAIDLVRNSSTELVERPDTLIIASFAQLQKLFQSVYYPKVITFSMQLTNLVEAIHKFTISYPISVVVVHKDTLLAANGGQVVSYPCDNPTKVWNGDTATNASTYWLWNYTKPLESVVSSFIQ